MTLDKETFIAISSGIAALGAITTFIKQFLVPKDRIIIGFGFPSQNYDRGAFLDIQNISAHSIRIRDLGFIKSDLKQLSLPDHIAACMDRDEMSSSGNLSLQPREICFARYGHDLDYIGAYAYTTAQKYPRIRFTNEIGFIQKVKVRFMIYSRFKDGYHYW